MSDEQMQEVAGTIPVEQAVVEQSIDPVGDQGPVETGDGDDEIAENPYDVVVKEFYSSANIEQGQAKVSEYLELDLKPVFNFNPAEDEIPNTHGLLVTPIAQRVNGVTENIGLLVAAVPSVESIRAYGEAGIAYINNAVESMLFAKVGNAVRPRDGVDSTAEVPFSIEDFITKRQMGDGLSAFNKIAPDFVKALKKKGLKRITTAILRDIISSASNAAHYFPKIPQETWVGIIGKMMSEATTQELDVAVYDNWLATRDETAGLHEVEDLNLDDLGI